MLPKSLIRCGLALGFLLPVARELRAQVVEPEVAEAPVVSLLYREIQHRTEFPFTLAERGQFTKAVGIMVFDVPDTVPPVGGLGQNQLAFCAEPLVPISLGQIHSFRVEPFDQPQFYGLPDTDAGRATAARRAGYVREFYGKHYDQVLVNPAVNGPAFQVALWELLHESDFPEVASPFSLKSGQFRADYANLDTAPEYVQVAERHLTGLVGNGSAFNESPLLRGQELVRLTGLAGPDGIVPQSQLTLRPLPESLSASGGGVGALSPGGVTGLAPGLGGGGIGGIGGSGFGSPVLPVSGGVGGGGLGGGGVFPPFLGGGSDSPIVNIPDPDGPDTPGGNTQFPPGRSPILDEPGPTPIVTPPSIPLPPTVVDPPGPPPGPDGPDGPDGPGNPPPVIPAPPALILGLIGAGLLILRRQREANSP